MTTPTPPRPVPHPGRLTVLAFVVAASALALDGCNIAGPLAYIIGGTPKIDAEYALEPRPTVVFVDDRANVITTNATALRLEIAEKVSEELMVQEILTPELTISPRDALGLVRAKDRYSDPLPIDAIGRLVGAEQIIYIEMYRFAPSPDGVTPRPIASCHVRVLDVENRRRLYPGPETDLSSRQIESMMREIDPSTLRTESGRLGVYRELAMTTGTTIAKLFYRHESRDLGDRLQSP